MPAEEIRRYARLGIKIILIGNKCDDIKNRVVFYDKAKRLADKHEICYFETSAKHAINIESTAVAMALAPLTNRPAIKNVGAPPVVIPPKPAASLPTIFSELRSSFSGINSSRISNNSGNRNSSSSNSNGSLPRRSPFEIFKRNNSTVQLSTAPAVLPSLSSVVKPSFKKVQFLGADNIRVGKSCLLLRISDDIYTDFNITSIWTDYRQITITSLQGVTVSLRMWDGNSTSQPRVDQEGCADIYVVCYDVTDSRSFDVVKSLIENKKSRFPNAKFLLAATKCDLSGQRIITTVEGQILANSLGCEYVETSAKTGQGCKEVEEKLALLAAEQPARRSSITNSRK